MKLVYDSKFTKRAEGMSFVNAENKGPDRKGTTPAMPRAE